MDYKHITQETLKSYKSITENDPAHTALQNAVINNGIKASAKSIKPEINMPLTFSCEIKTGEITNQKKSGRCWMFAGMNTLRKKVMEKCNLETFELSQNFILFYDKLEKSNYFYENILDTLDMPSDSRVVAWLLSAPLNDGGQWDMLCSVVEKYGVVPKWIMPETFHSSNTGDMSALMTRKLRKDAAILRRAASSGKSIDELREMKNEMMGDIYRILTRCLGTPPETFDFEYRDKDENFARTANLTPKAFYQEFVGIDLTDYVSLINAPTDDKPYGNTFTVQRLGNVSDGRPVKYLNVPIKELMAAALSQLESGEVVWFGCDVGKYLDRTLGIMSTEMYDFEEALGTSLEISKADQLDYCDSLMTHAMVFTGVNVVDGKPNRWKVENSWGEDPGRKGWFVMEDAWFEKYMYQVVVNKKFLTEAQLKALEKEPIELNPWDPMGSLAL